MTEREALKIALKWIEARPEPRMERVHQEMMDTITAIKEALAQPEQKPVAWKTDDIELYVREDKFGFYNIPLYTAPPQRKPLTDDEIDEIYFKSSLEVNNRCEDIYDFARALEAAHGIKE